MRGFTLLGREFLAILKNKKLLIPIIAVLFVPILYAGMFLWAFWDPYSHLQDLPVAVVNLDKGAVNDGESFHVGDEFVNNLKKNTNFKWDFVDEKTAMDGLQNRKYYMMVRVPANFSEDATTLLKDHPEKLQLEYVPNESANFLSSQIGGSAVEKIKEEIGTTLSATYAEKMFANLQKVSTGFEDASKGASQLHDVTGQLKDGSQELSGKLNEMSAGAPLLYGGSQKITNGLGELGNGSSQLLTGSQQITGKLNEMSAGAPLLYGGSQMITNTLGKLGNGASQLYTGSQQLSSNLNKISSGAPLLYAGSQKITDGLGELNSGLPKLYNGSLQLSDQLNKLNANAPELYKGAQGISSGATALADGASQWKAGADRASSGAKAASDGAEQVSEGLSQINQQLDALPEPYKSQFKAAMKKAIDGNSRVIAGTQQVADGTSTLAAKAGDISKGASSLAAGADQLTTGLGELKTGAPQLAKGASDLSNGLGQATTGASQLAAGSGQLTSSLSEIKDGAPLLADGANQLSKSLGQVTTGVNQLAAGSGQLTSSLSEIKDGAPLLADGSNRITTGLEQVTSGANQLETGSGQLTSSLGEIKDGAPLLANGSNQITDGLTKTNDGAGELSNKLGDGAKETGSIKGNQDNYQMFASPVQLKTEKIHEVPNYGTGFAPYFLSLGLFVGALLISIVFPMRETVGIPKTGFSWFISKFGILVGVGIFQSLIADLIMLAGLKIHVESIPMFILVSLVTSITFLVLVQFLVTAFGDAGRFIAIIILILQLTTSAGTFPLELLPVSLQPLNAWLPMTYSVFGFKAAISSGDYSFLWQNIGILMLYIVLFTAATIVALSVLHKRQFSRTVEEK